MEKLTFVQKECYRYLRDNNRAFIKSLGSMKNFIRFLNNIDVNFNKSLDRFNELSYIKNVKPQYLLIKAFSWAFTVEGDEFWRSINADYRIKIGASPTMW